MLQLSTAVPGLIVGILLSRLKDHRSIAILMSLFWSLSLSGMIWFPQFAMLWIVIGGFGSGASMIMGLSFIALRASSAHQAAALSGMSQSLGYLLAAAGPPLMGKIHDLAGSWFWPLMLSAILGIVGAIFGALSARKIQI